MNVKEIRKLTEKLTNYRSTQLTVWAEQVMAGKELVINTSELKSDGKRALRVLLSIYRQGILVPLALYDDGLDGWNRLFCAIIIEAGFSLDGDEFAPKNVDIPVERHEGSMSAQSLDYNATIGDRETEVAAELERLLIEGTPLDEVIKQVPYSRAQVYAYSRVQDALNVLEQLGTSMTISEGKRIFGWNLLKQICEGLESGLVMHTDVSRWREQIDKAESETVEKAIKTDIRRAVKKPAAPTAEPADNPTAPTDNPTAPTDNPTAEPADNPSADNPPADKPAAPVKTITVAAAKKLVVSGCTLIIEGTRYEIK